MAKVQNAVAIGLDLAWSERNPSGGAVIIEGVLVDACADLAGDDEITAWVSAWSQRGDAVVLAIDAPLCVPNQTGKRECERLLGLDWRKFGAGPYPSNRTRFAEIGIRGERLAQQLAQEADFVQTTELDAAVPGR